MKYFGKKVEYSTSNRKREDFKTLSRSGARSLLDVYQPTRFLIGCTLISIGILVSTSGGSWDITNHLLNKPETFFAPPHAVLYTGVALAILGSAIIFRGWRSSSIYYPELHIPFKLIVTGILMLIVAGPVD